MQRGGSHEDMQEQQLTCATGKVKVRNNMVGGWRVETARKVVFVATFVHTRLRVSRFAMTELGKIDPSCASADALVPFLDFIPAQHRQPPTPTPNPISASLAQSTTTKPHHGLQRLKDPVCAIT